MYTKLRTISKTKSALDEPPLTKGEKKAIKEYWKGYPVDKNWFWYYNRIQRNYGQFDVRYMPDDMFTNYVYDYFNKLEDVRAVDDKNYYNLYFPDVRQPKTIVHIIEGQCLDDNYMPISIEAAMERCVACGDIVCKLAVYSAGGVGIRFWDKGVSVSTLKEILTDSSNAVVQERICQHPSLEALHKDSVNTIRIMTWLRDGKVEVLSTIVRIGVDGSRVDNVGAGGFCCGVEEDGSLKQWGYRDPGEVSLTHPQGAVFGECRIVGVDKCKEVASRLAYRLARVAKIISWDFAVDRDGTPILIEMNLNNGALDIHQLANGPIFGDDTQAIVAEVMSKKKYRRMNNLLHVR